MKNKILWALLAVFVVGIVSFVGTTYAYRGDAEAKGPNYNADVHAQLEAAMDSVDYDAWLKIRQDNNLPMNGKVFQAVNKDNFGIYVEMHKANLAGDTAKADALRAELGIGQGKMMKHGGSGSSGCNGGCNGENKLGTSGSKKAFVDSDNDGACDNYKLHR